VALVPSGERYRQLAVRRRGCRTTPRKRSAQRGHAFLHSCVVLACSAHELAPRAYTPRDPTETTLYRLVAEQRATFAKVTAEQGHVPSFVNESFERFLRCGVPARGFARYQCTSCQHDHLVPLSCKARGLCPSCGGRRMMSLSRHVMDAVLPYVPTRQWVLTLPHALRYRVAYDQHLCTAVHRALARALRKRLRRLARACGQADSETGSVTFVQRWGSGLNLNPHYHLIGLDGWFHRDAAGQLAFTRAPTPTQEEVEALLLDVHARVLRLLSRRGLLDSDTDGALARDAPALSACYEGAVTQRMGLGPNRGRPVLKLGTSLAQHLASAYERMEGAGWLCARLDGFDLHGRVAGPRIADGKRAEARIVAGDAERELEREPGLAALGRTAEDAHAGAGPQRLDEPARPLFLLLDVGGAHDRQRVARFAIGTHHEPVPSSASAASSACSSRKAWFLSLATRIATRRILAAVRSTPRLAR
jgi:hypothetical protein